MSDRRSLQKYFRRALVGVLEGIIIITIYVYILPYMFSQLYQYMGVQAPNIMRGGSYLLVISVIIILTIISKIFRETLFRPIFLSSANLMGVLYALSFLGSGTLSLNNIEAGTGVYLDLTIDLSPFLLIVYMFFVIPSVIMPFISFFTSEEISEM